MRAIIDQEIEVNNNSEEKNSEEKEELEECIYDEVKKFVDFLLANCHLVVITITASDLTDSWKIFEVLNARGRNLSDIDIFKTLLLKDQDQKHHVDEWNKLEKDLGREKFSTFFSFIKKIEKNEEKNKVRAIQEMIKEDKKTQKKPLLIDKIFSRGRIYQKIVKYGEHDEWYDSTPLKRNIKRYMTYLNRLDSIASFSYWLPFTILCFEKYEQQEKNLLKVLKQLDRLCYCVLIMGGHVYNRRKQDTVLSSFVKFLKENHNVDDVIDNLKKSISDDNKRIIIDRLESKNASKFYNAQSSTPKLIFCRVVDLLLAYNIPYSITIKQFLTESFIKESSVNKGKKIENYSYKIGNFNTF